jgi:Uma2 family endonuclease
MVATPPAQSTRLHTPQITWEKLPGDYVLPDDPVDNIHQPQLANALRDGLETLGLISTQSLLPTNYGICATIDGKIAVKAPDWAYIPNIIVSLDEVERSYTPQLQGDFPLIVMEFLSESDGGEYSAKPTHPVGKWFFYEQILRVPNYIIFDHQDGLLEFYRLKDRQYELEQADPEGRHWIEEMGLFLGAWCGQRGELTGYWLRWWTPDGNLLPWATERADQEKTRADQAQALADQAQIQVEQAQAQAKQAQAQAEQAQTQADQAQAQTEQATERAEKLAEYLRSQGINPEDIH